MAYYVVEADRHMTYTASGTVRVDPRITTGEGTDGYIGAVYGTAIVQVPFGSMALTAEFENLNEGLGDPTTEWRIRYCLAVADGDNIYTDWLLLGISTFGVGWAVEPLIEIPWTFTFDGICDLVAERTTHPEVRTTEPDIGSGLPIWDGNPGDGLELSKLQTIDYQLWLKTWEITATLNGVSLGTPTTGDEESAPMTQFGVVAEVDSYITGVCTYMDVVASELTYTATNSADPGIVEDETTQYIDPGAPFQPGYVTALADGGHGGCSVRNTRWECTDGQPDYPRVYDSAIFGNPYYLPAGPGWAGVTTPLGQSYVNDSCNQIDIHPNLHLDYMWGHGGNTTAGDWPGDNRSEWQVVGEDKHNFEDEQWRINLNEGGFEYGGNYEVISWGYPSGGGEWVVADPGPGNETTIVHGSNRISRWTGTEWIDGLTADGLPDPLTNDPGDYTSATEHLIGGVALGQPAHWPWYPVPVHPAYDPEDPEHPVDPPWYDSTCYISNDHLEWTATGGMIQWQGLQPGAEMTDAGKRFDFVVSGTADPWTCTGCSVAVDGDELVLIPSANPATIALTAAQGLAKDATLAAGRFAIVHWTSDTDGATATITIGPHSWTITADGTDPQETRIDLCRPHITTSPSDPAFQSTIEQRLPFRKDWIGGVSVRPNEDVFTWDYPAGWGVDRVAAISITAHNASAEYRFVSINPTRWTDPLGGGGQYLVVLPHQASWNDTRALELEAGIHFAGEEVYNEDGDSKFYYEYVKAFILVDGKVVWEQPGGCIWFDSDDDPPIYHHVEYEIGDIHDASTYDLFPPTTNDFLFNNLLWQGLKPGWYNEDDETFRVGCDYQLMTNVINHPNGMNGAEFWNLTTWSGGGACYGLAFAGHDPAADTELSINTPNASTGRGRSVVTHASPAGLWPYSVIPRTILEPYALNTRAESAVDNPIAVVAGIPVTLRNRMLSRLCVEITSPTSGGIMVDYSHGAGRLYAVYAGESGIALLGMDAQGNEVNEAVTATATDNNPSVAVHHHDRQDRLFCAYQTAGGEVVLRISANSGISWGAAVSIATGSYPAIVSAAAGVVLCAYYSGGSVYVKRSLDLGTTWGTAVEVADDSADDRADLTPVPGRHDTFWLVYRKASDSSIVRMISDDGGVTWA